MFERPMPFVSTLIILCIACYVPELMGFDVNSWMAVSHSSLEQAPWQLVTAMFAHNSIEHLVMNLISLWWLGTFLEYLEGHLRFGLVYFTSGIIGNLAYALLGSGFAVGASGAIFGLLGASLVMFFHFRKNIVGQTFAIVLAIMGAINVVNSFLPGIALEAHFTGLFVGAALEGLLLLTGFAFPKRVEDPIALLDKL